jgi:tetratricopeptide (TPR) repeat protein
MLDITRAFGREMLFSARDRYLSVRERILEFFTAYSVRAATALRGSEQITWLERLEREWPNLRYILAELFLDGRIEEAVRMSVHLGWYWYLTGRGDTAANYLRDALDREDQDLPSGLRAWALHTLGWALFTGGRWSAARDVYLESYSLFSESGDAEGSILVRAHLGVVERWMGNEQEGIDLTEDAVALAREGASASTKAVALIWAYATSDGRIISPGQHEGLEEALRGCRSNGDLWGTAHALQELGDLNLESCQ